MGNKCVLCGEEMRSGQKLNREHLVPATAIRNFKRLGIPDRMDWSLRVDMREPGNGEALLAGRSAHTSWATMVVHQQCNTDASPMCQDLKQIIDNLERPSTWRRDRIVSYYADLWGEEAEDLVVRVFSKDELAGLISSSDKMLLLYQPGWLWLGRILICVKDQNKLLINQPDYEKYNIFIGSHQALEEYFEEIGYDCCHRRFSQSMGVADRGLDSIGSRQLCDSALDC